MGKYFIGLPISNVESKRNPKDLHLTLSYLGEQSNDSLKKVVSKLNKIKNNEKSFNLYGDNFKRFGKKYPHLNVDMNYRLNSLIKYFNKDTSNFIPHVTIGPDNIKRLPNKKEHTIPVNQVILYKIKDNIDYNNYNKQRYEPYKIINLKNRNYVDKTLDFFKNIPYWSIFK